MLHQYTLQELSHTLWALAIFEHHPGALLPPPAFNVYASEAWVLLVSLRPQSRPPAICV